MPEPEKQLHALNPTSLRGLAHPLRMRLLDALRREGSATASQLAERLGESSGATSYHLRQLASAGLIEDDPERGKGRERWWRPVHRGIRADRIEDFLDHPDPEVRGAMSLYLHELAAQHALELGTALATMHSWPEEWRGRWTLSDYTLTLTPDLAEELRDKIHELIVSYQDKVDEHTEHARKVRIHLHGFPRESE
ncbi:ArsR/SmtB family transcription factor [Streptomyces sp. KLOTTS4A1]|uniref:ArsR/SmtB family transcription factor n=1 Tax=Streptomyces sp. KLOTTS4A1 TaxID=3390996 RepID=UPI0039F50838